MNSFKNTYEQNQVKKLLNIFSCFST